MCNLMAVFLCLAAAVAGVRAVPADDHLLDVFRSLESNGPRITYTASGDLSKYLRQARAHVGSGRQTCRQRYTVGDHYATCRGLPSGMDNIMPRNQAVAQLDHVGGCILRTRTLNLTFPVIRDDVRSVMQAGLYIPTVPGASPLRARLDRLCLLNSHMQPLTTSTDHCHQTGGSLQPIADWKAPCSPVDVKEAYRAALSTAAAFMDVTVELDCQSCAGTLSGFPYILVDYVSFKKRF